MAILTPTTAVEGTLNLIITGTGMSGTPQLVATDSVKTFTVDLDVNSQSATIIDINLNLGLAGVINDALLAHDGSPLTDSNWSLKWVVGGDELGVVVSAPANHQQREIDNAEKFGGWLNGINFSERDQQVGVIIAGTNKVKHTESNGKATGSLDGVADTMSETITNYFFTVEDGKWRARDVVITPFSGGDEFTEEFGPEFT